MDPLPRKIAVTYSIDRNILAEFQAWLDEQPFRPSKTAVVEVALREFLQRQKTKKR
jgi:hypothetical protein